jgi:hypothetical protein
MEPGGFKQLRVSCIQLVSPRLGLFRVGRPLVDNLRDDLSGGPDDLRDDLGGGPDDLGGGPDDLPDDLDGGGAGM